MAADDAPTGLTKRDVIVDELRRLILSGGLARGARLPQDELARRFESSITPVREALRALEAEGLVVSQPHRGTRVAAVDLDRVKATYVVRRLVEGYAMRRVATRLTIRDLQQVTRLVVAFDDACAEGEELRARQANRDLHFYFYDRTGIPALSGQIAALWAAFPWDLVLASSGRAEASSREHQEILDAVRAGDPDRAAAAVERHIQQGFLAIARHVVGGELPDPFDPDVD